MPGLTIAGLRLEVHAPGLRPVQAAQPVYAAFIGAGASPDAPADIRVDVVSGPAPAGLVGGPGERLVFDTGVSWSLYRRDDGYRISFRLAGETEEYLHALSDAATTSVRVFADAAPLSRAAGRDVWLADPVCYPLDQLLLMNHLAQRGGVVVHSCVLSLGDAGFVCCGASGAGKTTLARALMAAGLEEAVLSDDRAIVRVDAGGAVAWGTPWPGDAGIARNSGAPLAALLFLTQAPPGAGTSALTQISAGDAFKRLLPVVSCPWYDEEGMAGVFATCERLVSEHPCYDFAFRPDESAARALRDLAAGAAG